MFSALSRLPWWESNFLDNFIMEVFVFVKILLKR